METHNMRDANMRRELNVLFERVLKLEADGFKPGMPESGDFRRAYLDYCQTGKNLYGIPLLFPGNRTKMGEFQFDGKMYRLPLNEPERGNHIHGLMFDAPFTVNRKTESCICAVYENVSERYPVPFRMEITDFLSEKGFHRVVSILNAEQAVYRRDQPGSSLVLFCSSVYFRGSSISLRAGVLSVRYL